MIYGPAFAIAAQILERLGIEPMNWVPLARDFGRLFHRVAGAPRTLDHPGRERRFRLGRAALLGTGQSNSAERALFAE